MIVPIWRKVFLFRFKRERTTPESLIGADSGFVPVGALSTQSPISLISVIPAQAGIQLPHRSVTQSWFPAYAGMTAEAFKLTALQRKLMEF